MENIVKVVGVLLVSLFITSIGGILVWLLWPVFSQVLPNAEIPEAITLWQAVKLSWVCAFLFKGGFSSQKND